MPIYQPNPRPLAPGMKYTAVHQVSVLGSWNNNSIIALLTVNEQLQKYMQLCLLDHLTQSQCYYNSV